jgi:1-acyl-sn-glycerol-3-phosphate acyltransferase
MIYWLAWHVFRLLLRVFGRWQVTGAENVPMTGPVILAANHLSFADPPTVGAGIRRKAWFMGKEELFRSPFLRWLFGKWQAFPVRRGTGDLGALKKALQVLAAGDPLVIFPEGTRHRAGEPGGAELGVGMLALRSGAPVIPVFLSGTDKMLPRSGFLHFAKVRVRYGAPITFPACARKPDRNDYAEAADEVMRAILALRE